MREWAVSGALIANTAGLLLVQNRRRDGSVDWSPPGGVVDPGETFVGALTREVAEETGLIVTNWSPIRYHIDVNFIDANMHLVVEVYEALAWDGHIAIEDPDGIVEAAEFCAPGRRDSLLETSPPWVREPVAEWLADQQQDAHHFGYDVSGVHPAKMRAKRL